MNEIVSYQSINGLGFGEHAIRADEFFGKPILEKKNRDGELEKHYNDFILRFTPDTNCFREATVPFGIPTLINGENVDWSVAGMKSLCRADEEPFELYGSVILFQRGLSLTGLEEGAEADRSLTIFSKGDWDAFKSEMMPVVF